MGVLREEKFQKKKAAIPLCLLLLGVVDCVLVSVDVALVTLTCAVLRGCGQVEAVELEHANPVCLCA